MTIWPRSNTHRERWSQSWMCVCLCVCESPAVKGDDCSCVFDLKTAGGLPPSWSPFLPLVSLLPSSSSILHGSCPPFSCFFPPFSNLSINSEFKNNFENMRGFQKMWHISTIKGPHAGHCDLLLLLLHYFASISTSPLRVRVCVCCGGGEAKTWEVKEVKSVRWFSQTAYILWYFHS